MPLPSLDQANIDIKQIKASADGLVDDVVNSLWLVIKGGYRRNDNRAILCDRQHAAQVTGMQRRLTHQQHQTAPFFQGNVGGPAQQRIGRTMRSIESVRIEHGAITIPRVLNDPDEMTAPTSAF